MKFTHYSKLILCLLPLVLASVNASANGAAYFTGGACASQGDWMRQAMIQADVVLNALNTLKNDPNCSALVESIGQLDQNFEQSAKSAQIGGFVEMMSELKSIRELMPRMTSINQQTSNANPAQSTATLSPQFGEVLKHLAMRKSMKSIEDLYSKAKGQTLSPAAIESIELKSAQVESFLNRMQSFSRSHVSTIKTIAAKLPEHQLCFSNRPSEALAVFSGIISSVATFASGGQISGLGDVITTLQKFSRDMVFANAVSKVELERYRASVSCLVESTQEAYCSLVDAKEALAFSRGQTLTQSRENQKMRDPRTNPMYGLMVLLRDVPTITKWMQRVLFGINPRLKIEADMKNINWDNILQFIKQTNSLPGEYRDKVQVYYESTKGLDIKTKASQVKSIIDSLSDQMSGGRGFAGADMNYFTLAISKERIPFFLMGMDDPPPDYNSTTNTFDNLFTRWISEGAKGLDQPDNLIPLIETRLNILIERASALSSSYFSTRMIVDSQNLIVEAMNGPEITAFPALNYTRDYSLYLIQKLDEGLKDPVIANDSLKADSYKAMKPLLSDLVARINRMIKAMKEIQNIKIDPENDENAKLAAQKIMDVIYISANMLTSRDSFIATRLLNAVKMDLSDTVWRNLSTSPEQHLMLQSYGQDIVSRISEYFGSNTNIQQLDIAQAERSFESQLDAIEDVFWHDLYSQILEIDCATKGFGACSDYNHFQQERLGFWGGLAHKAAKTIASPIKSVSDGMVTWIKTPSNDSPNLKTLKAKLCLQSLSFKKHRHRFSKPCSDTQLMSEYSDREDKLQLNTSYKNVVNKMSQIQNNSESPNPIWNSNREGTCALRTHLRKNYVYRLYLDLLDR